MQKTETPGEPKISTYQEMRRLLIEWGKAKESTGNPYPSSDSITTAREGGNYQSGSFSGSIPRGMRSYKYHAWVRRIDEAMISISRSSDENALAIEAVRINYREQAKPAHSKFGGWKRKPVEWRARQLGVGSVRTFHKHKSRGVELLHGRLRAMDCEKTFDTAQKIGV